jgi:hypothetical protein
VKDSTALTHLVISRLDAALPATTRIQQILFRDSKFISGSEDRGRRARQGGCDAKCEYNLQYGGAIMGQHSHKFTIADDDAVRVLLAKLVKGSGKQARRDKLLRALDDAARHYKDSNQKVRQAFFHGLLTGYAVALTLR